MPVTPEQAQQLASLARAIRPHGARRWDEAGVVAAIGHVRTYSLADVALAVIRAADDRNIETPGVIANTKSPCWREKSTDRPQPIEPWRADKFCHVCGKSSHLGASDHEFETAIDHERRLAHADPKPKLPRVKEQTA